MENGQTTVYLGAIEVQITATQRITKAYYSAGGQLIALRVYTSPTSSVLYYLHSDHPRLRGGKPGEHVFNNR